jgi:hypothetical protein
VAPGQAVVLYDADLGDRVLGGGTATRAAVHGGAQHLHRTATTANQR